MQTGPARASAVPAASAQRLARWSSIADAARALGIVQGARLAGCALAAFGDWARTGLACVGRAERERRELRTALSTRTANRVAAMLGALKGPFAKLGQFAAVRLDVLPPEWTRALAALRDRVPPLPFARVRAAVEAELARPLEACFAEFEPSPLGAASIAQVHLARLASGERVAVKVQYPWLARSLTADLAWIRLLARCAAGVARRRRRGPALAGLDLGRLLDEFGAGLRAELDFEREGKIAGEIAANLRGDGQVVVPEMLPELSSQRVLTMRFHPCVGIQDRAGLARLGVDPGRVLEILTRAYAKQVFADGLFHADPHPGNLFVIDEPEAAEHPRVLFVDFGLSRRLDPQLRRELRLGIFAVLKRDVDAFLAGMDRMDMIAPGAHAGVRRAIESMLERIGSQNALTLGGAQVLSLKDEAKALLQQTDGLQLPNDLLLYAKTLSYVFALGADLAPQVDVMKLSLPYALKFLTEE